MVAGKSGFERGTRLPGDEFLPSCDVTHPVMTTRCVCHIQKLGRLIYSAIVNEGPIGDIS